MISSSVYKVRQKWEVALPFHKEVNMAYIWGYWLREYAWVPFFIFVVLTVIYRRSSSMPEEQRTRLRHAVICLPIGLFWLSVVFAMNEALFVLFPRVATERWSLTIPGFACSLWGLVQLFRIAPQRIEYSARDDQ
jgi:hypothetical protein